MSDWSRMLGAVGAVGAFLIGANALAPSKVVVGKGHASLEATQDSRQSNRSTENARKRGPDAKPGVSAGTSAPSAPRVPNTPVSTKTYPEPRAASAEATSNGKAAAEIAGQATSHAPPASGAAKADAAESTSDQSWRVTVIPADPNSPDPVAPDAAGATTTVSSFDFSAGGLAEVAQFPDTQATPAANAVPPGDPQTATTPTLPAPAATAASSVPIRTPAPAPAASPVAAPAPIAAPTPANSPLTAGAGATAPRPDPRAPIVTPASEPAKTIVPADAAQPSIITAAPSRPDQAISLTADSMPDDHPSIAPVLAAHPDKELILCLAGCGGRMSIVTVRPRMQLSAAQEGMLVPSSAIYGMPGVGDVICVAGCSGKPGDVVYRNARLAWITDDGGASVKDALRTIAARLIENEALRLEGLPRTWVSADAREHLIGEVSRAREQFAFAGPHVADWLAQAPDRQAD